VEETCRMLKSICYVYSNIYFVCMTMSLSTVVLSLSVCNICEDVIKFLTSEVSKRHSIHHWLYSFLKLDPIIVFLYLKKSSEKQNECSTGNRTRRLARVT